jgi:sugar lactone lactonase YvrE
LGGAITGGAKLVEVSLATNRIVRTLPLNDVIGKGGYLADVRFHASRRIAVLPDLASGALAVVDLTSGGGRRVLEGHISTQAEDITLNFGGKPWLYADGSRPRTAATSLAFSPDGRTLYFKALIGRRLYSVPTSALMAGNREAASAVRPVVLAHPTDAIAFGSDGFLYMTAIDRSAITRWAPGAAQVETVVEDGRLAWPVGLTFGPRGHLYTTVGRIHEGATPSDRYRLFRFLPLPARG